MDQRKGAQRYYVRLDRSWRFTLVSPDTAARWGREPSQLIGIDARGMFFPDPGVAAVDAALATRQPQHAEFRSPLQPDVWLRLQATPVEDGVEVWFWDTTADRAARQGAALLQVPSADWQVDEETEAALVGEAGEVVSLSPAMGEALARWAPADGGPGVGARFVDLCRLIVPDLADTELERGLSDLSASRVETFFHPYIAGSAEGRRTRQLRISRVTIAGAQYVLAVNEDLTEIARASQASRGALAQLESARAVERAHIALELHDSTSQHLAVLSMGVARLRRLHGEDPAARNILDDMGRTLREALKEVRVITHLMRPLSLQRDGLEATTRRLVTGFGLRTGLNAAFQTEGDIDAAEDAVQRAVLRVIQEALTNVHRHAEGATNVSVALSRRDGALDLQIIDDGPGMGASQSDHADAAGAGMGLAGMRSRVGALGGSLTIVSDAGGTVVTARLPTGPKLG
jgi:signal transduction histidine kinase